MPTTLRTAQLTPDEQDAVKACMESVDKAPLKEGSDSEVNLQRLDQVVQRFVERFEPWAKVISINFVLITLANLRSSQLDNRDSKLTALQITRPTILAVPNKVVLIPFAINPNNPTIAKQAIETGSYMFLTENVLLEPGTRCLAFLAQ